MKIVSKGDKRIADLFSKIENVKGRAEKAFEGNRPLFKGERYLTDDQLSKRLNLSRRTLHTYRTEGLLPFIQFGGKVLYKESDIENLLSSNYEKAWKE
ncbi:excisionase family DNA binding protein [Dysgonomonas sp. PFB1-18]|uniref:helix-turn-helix domain-containing protein n=1 Tax=unclassified Dysgonomonas TaxID=2630389 RepID=UPI00247489C5|nr:MULTISPECIES: helix-turn-helix domain-containing protein [unclassified Dysgonomonas]MDH6309365.1 excisionase family DNA binding protein [Dysgonomonas sp. PF1-14]MDH6339770.1 excisionase family DNA binding protein [Dysgonomonas sp. PF1-16]MDH6381418.1 excisionase family DNA binding protein [Dysgonomonas sp. PFB1-18]MDH6398633.1 excisionase family DNA binding protein [Dysgonomonas sp. PF1-23]